jgi:hypothetical protein
MNVRSQSLTFVAVGLITTVQATVIAAMMIILIIARSPLHAVAPPGTRAPTRIGDPSAGGQTAVDAG